MLIGFSLQVMKLSILNGSPGHITVWMYYIKLYFKLRNGQSGVVWVYLNPLAGGDSKHSFLCHLSLNYLFSKVFSRGINEAEAEMQSCWFRMMVTVLYLTQSTCFLSRLLLKPCQLSRIITIIMKCQSTSEFMDKCIYQLNI